MSNLNVVIKRWFLELAFFPYGGDVTKKLGMVPASDDVEETAQRKARKVMQATYAKPVYDDVIRLARWYIEAATAAQEFGHAQRTGEEHLVSFVMAMLAAGVVVPPTQEGVIDG